jgi:hypothetical protein
MIEALFAGAFVFACCIISFKAGQNHILQLFRAYVREQQQKNK